MPSRRKTKVSRATLEEVKTAVNLLTRFGSREELIILHCNTEYPTPDEDVNLSAIDALHEEFPDIRIGFSDHSVGYVAAIGAVMKNIVLADELNRTSPKTQSALLEAMEEHQVTIDGKTFQLPELFMVLATQNPVEQLGTYMLPEAELDRFLMKISIGYPKMEMQKDMAKRFLEGTLEKPLTPVLKAEDIIQMKEEVKQVTMTDEIVEYALSIVDASRSNDNLEYGLSPRAGLDLLIASKAAAYVAERDYVIPEDVISMAKKTLPHRMILTTQSKMNRYTGSQLIVDIIEKINRPN